MLTIDEAIRSVESNNKPNQAIGAAETDELFIIALDNDEEAYKTVDKESGAIGDIWIWDYIDLNDEGKIKVLDINSINTRRAS